MNVELARDISRAERLLKKGKDHLRDWQFCSLTHTIRTFVALGLVYLSLGLLRLSAACERAAGEGSR